MQVCIQDLHRPLIDLLVLNADLHSDQWMECRSAFETCKPISEMQVLNAQTCIPVIPLIGLQVCI